MADRRRKQVLLRLDPAVHAAIAKWAADDLRSVNSQIEIILRRALADLEAYYGVPLRTTEPDRLLTGDFSADSLETLLKVIEQAMDVEIEALSGQSGKPTPALPKGG